MIELMLEEFREYHLVLLVELFILTPLYVEQETVLRRALLVFLAALASFIACMFLYGFTDAQEPRWVAGETVFFVMPIILVASSVATAVAICRMQDRSFGTKIAAGLSAGLVAVAVGPAIFWYVGFIIGGDF